MTTNAVKFQFSVTRLRCFGKTDSLRRGVTGTLISQYLHVTLGGVRPIEKRLVCSPLDRKSPLKFNEIVIINMYLFLQFESTAL